MLQLPHLWSLIYPQGTSLELGPLLTFSAPLRYGFLLGALSDKTLMKNFSSGLVSGDTDPKRPQPPLLPLSPHSPLAVDGPVSGTILKPEALANGPHLDANSAEQEWCPCAPWRPPSSGHFGALPFPAFLLVTSLSISV